MFKEITYRWTAVLIFLLFFSCKKTIDNDNQSTSNKIEVIDLEEIKEKGVLKALVDNSSTSYFIYKGQPMGFEYDLLKKFCEHIEVNLAVIPIKNLDLIIDNLTNCEGDLIASNLTVTRERKNKVSFSDPIITSRQVLVQRQLNKEDIQKGKILIDDPADLIGKEVHVRKSSSFYKRLKNLSDEIGGDITIKKVSGELTVEQMIESVSKGDIDYTVADEHVARINKSYYRNLNTEVPISLGQRMAWAVRKESPNLILAINEWLDSFKQTLEFRMIYLKYFGNSKLYRNRLSSSLFTSKSGQLSPYDEVIRKESTRINWDWRLVTSLIYQESKFNPEASSWTGASGLMQLMPTTAKEFGLDSIHSAEENIRTGIKYIEWIEKQLKDSIPNESERIKFTLAAYNVGIGHVFDAMRLATKYGLDKQVWDENVANMLLNKSKPKYYKDDIVHYGYCRGSEPYNYVEEIFERFRNYQNITDNWMT